MSTDENRTDGAPTRHGDGHGDGDKGRVVIVTGAGAGLGEAFARALAKAGARVIVSNRQRPGAPDRAARVAAEICAAGGAALADLTDMSEAGAGARVVASALAAFGRLDAVIANAGSSGPAQRVSDMAQAAEVFDAVMTLNLTGNVELAQAAYPHLKASGRGRLLLVSSSAGAYGVRGRAAYAASKGALNALAMTLAAEWRRDGIGVNALLPFAATRMTQDQGLDETAGAAFSADAVAPVAAWLVSADCVRSGECWVTGAGVLRRLKSFESEGALIGGDNVEAAATTQDAMPGLRGFAGAEAAFGDMLQARMERLEGRACG